MGALPAVVLGLLVAGCTAAAPPVLTAPSVTPPVAAVPSVTPSPSASPLDTSNWIVYKSKQYGFSLKHPLGWTVEPSAKYGHAGGELFLTPAEDLYVRVWSTPIKDLPESLEGVAAWVELYCKQVGYSCALDQAVPLCNGRDCHPGLLVGVDDGFVEAFFTGGQHKGQIVGVEVGLPESAENVAKYGGARRLLEGFLFTMDVCPARPDQRPQGCL
ncbi:MAG: hypothetical protein IPL43_10335 [Micropruina sp.]|nr:hypothetical protein [Micropruina sp.]